MKKYKIVPKRDFTTEIEASSPEEAMAMFATVMDTDMNLYFRAVPADEAGQQAFEEHAKLVKGFMFDELTGTYTVPADDALVLADKAYELYCEGSGLTEYECISKIYNAFIGEEAAS